MPPVGALIKKCRQSELLSKSALVLYYVCPEETSGLIHRPEAIESQSLEGSPSVEGECVENSSTESVASPILICGTRGQWQVIKHCLCNPGYELDSSMDMCSGMTRGYSY